MLIVEPSSRTIRTWHEFKIRACRRERFFERQFTFSGGGIEKEPVITSGVDELGHARHKLHGPVIREGKERLMLVDLGRWLEPEEVEVVQIEHTFIDPEGRFEPFLGAFVKPECQRISIEVLLPNIDHLAVRAEECPPESALPRSRHVLGSRSEVVDGISYELFEKTWVNPEAGTNVRISWIKQE
jgi:hypothetical protein